MYENWDFKQADVLMVFLNQRMLAAPDETRHIWKLDGPLEDVPNDEVPSMAWLHMAHTGPLPPIWDLLDLQPSAETLHLLSLVEFTDLLNGCAPDALVRNVFVILCMIARSFMRRSWRHTDPWGGSGREGAAVRRPMPTPRQSSFSRTNLRPCPTSIKRPRLQPLSQWNVGQLRGQIGLVQQDLARSRNDLTAALAQTHTQVADLDDRLKASVATERKASARSNQQATSLAELSARLQQQLDSSRANDERMSQSLRQRRLLV